MNKKADIRNNKVINLLLYRKNTVKRIQMNNKLKKLSQ